ncbi:hypothetical protein EV361DRAFT_945812 [Lentinula raphanica]|uniref:Uncharacterized protein n=1 Tax=Lentinula raphanica TaxID=153919 RepID=A0AA38P2J5_9AGAR|nr:hypothetical protein C8R42DRAFT_728670 [Lentinula raphanica]KAJ3769134.1 hypothetical protein FB446DRAFT_847949 [Lentinula raphanica]KAJ3826727.1 hypothetical protein F5880DRAFT_1609975 [Lentinula raphanica]KAJ3835104.1 hypothetical protein F5878DRAFT_664174 [Lentinula raphanica]KAJ3975845.1 hypothetical protein EV361DRAFT_945812 [Lentinula raphanica]
MRFTFASVIFVVVAALVTMFTVEAAAIHRPQAREVVEVVTRAVPGPNVAAQPTTAEKEATPVEKRGRVHARDFRRF